MREVSSVKLATFLSKLPEVNVQNLDDKLIEMGLGLKSAQIKEIKCHLEIAAKKKSTGSIEKASVKTEPEDDLTPPTPKISRKVRDPKKLF